MAVLRIMLLLFSAMLAAMGMIGVAVDPAGWSALVAGLVLFVAALIAPRLSRLNRRRHRRTPR